MHSLSSVFKDPLHQQISSGIVPMTSSTLLQILQKKYKSVQSIPVIVKIIAPFHNYYHIMGLYNYHNNFLSGHKGPKNLPRQE